MNKKVLLQLSLIIVIFLTCFVFYKLFFVVEVVEFENIEKNELEKTVEVKKGSNQINDIVYNSKYLDDNNYIIKAEYGEFNQDNPDFMLLTNVKGTIFFKNSDTIEISSKNANYNSLNYNTNFYNDVLITYNEHQINSDNFDLSFDTKIGTVYNNIVYKNLNTILRADKMDIDLITKDSKIYMIDESKKIEIKNLN